MTEATSKTEKSQRQKFEEATRKLECDDDEQRFKEPLEKLVRSVKNDSKDHAKTDKGDGK